MPLTQGAFGHDQQENEVSGASFQHGILEIWPIKNDDRYLKMSPVRLVQVCRPKAARVPFFGETRSFSPRHPRTRDV